MYNNWDGVRFPNDIHDALCATPALLSLTRVSQTDLSDFLYIHIEEPCVNMNTLPPFKAFHPPKNEERKETKKKRRLDCLGIFLEASLSGLRSTWRPWKDVKTLLRVNLATHRAVRH
jgi:hypothetical protein